LHFIPSISSEVHFLIPKKCTNPETEELVRDDLVLNCNENEKAGYIMNSFGLISDQVLKKRSHQVAVRHTSIKADLGITAELEMLATLSCSVGAS
jgi:hypothetical protein